MKQPNWLKRVVTGGVSAVTVLGGLATFASPAHALASFTGTNVYGTDRYNSADISTQKAFPSGVSTVALADGLPGHESDALAASGWAGVNAAGVLLTDNTNTVPTNTLNALKNNKVKNVVVFGGTSAVSAAQVAQLTAAGYTVTTPFQGSDRWHTMQMVDDSIGASNVGLSGGIATAGLASGLDNHLIDALSAGGTAYADKFPVILTDGSVATLNAQAQQVITTLAIKKLIVAGGTASIPTSQYSPAPSGVTTVDTAATTGADRSATAKLWADNAIKNYGLTNPPTNVVFAAGATFVGNTQQTQNDGADALSSAPLAGVNKLATIITNSPLDSGSANAWATEWAGSLDPGPDIVTGPANLTASQVSDFEKAGQTAPAVGQYTLSPSAATPEFLAQGKSQAYTVSGITDSAVDVALFSCGNVTLSPAFAASAPFLNSTNPNQSSGNIANQGLGGAVNNTITVVNGAAEPAGQTAINGIVPQSGTVTFSVTNTDGGTAAPSCVVPVVYAQGTGGVNTLTLNSTNNPATQNYGLGGAAVFSPNAAITGTYNNVLVVSNVAPLFMFVGCTGVNQCHTFSYASTANTYTYNSPNVNVTQGQFGADLSGPVTAPTSPAGLQGATPDVLGTVSYDAPSTATPNTTSTFSFVGGIDAPAAPTAVSATTCDPNTDAAASAADDICVSWTAPANQDVTSTTNPGSYNVYRATVTSGTVGSFALVSTVNGTDPTSNVSGTAYTDTDPGAGTYEYAVQAVPNAGNFGVPNGGGGGNGPTSAPSANVTIGSTAAALTPVSVSTSYVEGATGQPRATLGASDAMTIVFANVSASNPLTVASNASITFNDKDGTALTLTNGVNSTFTVSGASSNTLNIAVTTTPIGTANGGDTTLETTAGTWGISATSGITNSAGSWNLEASGLDNAGLTATGLNVVYTHGVTRQAYTTNSTATPSTGPPSLAASNTGANPNLSTKETSTGYVGPGGSTVAACSGGGCGDVWVNQNNGTINIQSGIVSNGGPVGGTGAPVQNHIANGDPFVVTNANGVTIASGTYSVASGSVVTASPAFAAGDTLYFTYLGNANTTTGAGQPSVTLVLTNPTAAPVVTGVSGGEGVNLSVTWSTPVNESGAASSYTVYDSTNSTLVATGTGTVTGSGTATLSVPLNTSLSAGNYVLRVAANTVTAINNGFPNSAQAFGFPASAGAAATPGTISSLSPNTGPDGGGNLVNVNGTGFAAGATVSFCGNPATVNSVTPTVINVTAPAGIVGACGVTETNPGAAASNASTYTYSGPTISSVTAGEGTAQSPAAGPVAGTGANDYVNINGTGFVVGSSTVTICGNAATVDPASTTTQLLVHLPVGAVGACNVVVNNPGPTNPGSATAVNAFTYVANGAVFTSAAEASTTSITVTFNDLVCGSSNVAADWTVSGSSQGVDAVTAFTGLATCNAGDTNGTYSFNLTLGTALTPGQTVTVTLVAGGHYLDASATASGSPQARAFAS